MKRISLKRTAAVPAALAAVLLMCLLLGACDTSPTAVPAEPQTGLTVTDALGRTVVFDAPPPRIVAAGKSVLTIANALYLFPEAGERLVGVVVGKQPLGEFLSLVDPAWDEKAILAPDAGSEQIAPLNPDVVLLRSFMADSLGRALEELQIPVVYADLETPEQYFRDVAVLGQLLGNPARAGAIRDFYRSGLDRIEKVIESTAGQEPRVLLVQHSEEGGEVAFKVPPAVWLQTTEVELAGGSPVWKEAGQAGGWTVVNFEQIAVWDPEQVFVVSYQADSVEIVERLKADPQWQSLQAVQSGAIYGFPGDIFSWDQPDPRWLLGVTWLAHKIQPDRFPRVDMKQETVAFFSQMYGMDEEAVEAGLVPKLTGSVE